MIIEVRNPCEKKEPKMLQAEWNKVITEWND